MGGKVSGTWAMSDAPRAALSSGTSPQAGQDKAAAGGGSQRSLAHHLLLDGVDLVADGLGLHVGAGRLAERVIQLEVGGWSAKPLAWMPSRRILRNMSNSRLRTKSFRRLRSIMALSSDLAYCSLDP